MKVPSRAKLGHFNFQAETELTICASLSSKFFRFSNFASVTWFESISWWSIIHLNFCSIKVHNFVIFQCFSEQVYYKKNLGLFLLNFQFRAEVEKVTSRTELKNLQLELWLEPALLGLITSISTVSYIKQLNLDAYISLFLGGVAWNFISIFITNSIWLSKATIFSWFDNFGLQAKPRLADGPLQFLFVMKDESQGHSLRKMHLVQTWVLQSMIKIQIFLYCSNEQFN